MVWSLWRAYWNWNCMFRTKENTILVWPLGLLFLSRTRIIFLQMPRRIIFYLTRDWSKDDVGAIQGLLLWDQKLLQNQYQNGSKKIIFFFTSSIVSVLLNYCLNFLENWRFNILIPIRLLIFTVIFPKFLFAFKRNINKVII